MSADSHPGAYGAAGVDYGVLDAAKRRALAAALSTSQLPLARGARLLDASRGEPAVVVEVGGATLGFVVECLGTKSTIAREYEELTGVDRFDSIGYDAVAAIVNDLCSVGALPIVVNAYFATGSPSWYAGSRSASLVEGWRRGCEDAGAAWGGGESPTLAGVIAESEVDLAGAAVGVVPPGGSRPWLGAALAPGDEIVLVASSGLHANGASLARRVAAGLADGLRTRLASGTVLGEALLGASALYPPLVEEIVRRDLPVSYVSPITGHGLRKLMRADRELTYRVRELPAVPEVLAFLAAAAGLSPAEAYATFNMGAGLAVFCRPGAGAAAVAAAASVGLPALVAGSVEEGPRRVVLEPLRSGGEPVEYGGSELELR